jgi:DNA repair exonuclease SbcCD nuclease subunit
VIHTGDTHVGYRQYHSPERRRDFLDAFEAVIDDAVGSASASDPAVDAVVHAGDLFHDRRPDLPDLLGVLSALRRLAAADVPFLAVVGNHEATRGSQWLDLFADLGLASRLGAEPTVVGDTAFYGLDHVPPSRRDDLDYEFVPHDADAAALVAHGLFSPFPHADWDTEAVLSAATIDFDAVLLGDNHAADTAEVADTWVTYCGSTERASADERDPRGYNLAEFDADAGGTVTVDIRRRSIETRPFVFVDVELAAGEGIERVRERLRQHDVEDAVVVVSVTGNGEPIAPAGVEEAALEAGALLARVTDHRAVGGEEPSTAPEVDFADPDAAVDERLREMELSSIGRRLDGTVRDDAVADANVRDRVAGLVADAVETDELGDASARNGGSADPDDPDRDGGGAGHAETAGGSEDAEAPESDGVPSDSGATDDQVSMEDFL